MTQMDHFLGTKYIADSPKHHSYSVWVYFVGFIYETEKTILFSNLPKLLITT